MITFLDVSKESRSVEIAIIIKKITPKVKVKIKAKETTGLRNKAQIQPKVGTLVETIAIKSKIY